MISIKIRKEEEKINDILFKICIVVTIIAMGMMLIEFFTVGAFPPTRISLFYMIVLLVYSFHKEALRWIEKEGDIYQQRRGEIFVYLWIIITALLYLINFISHDYFSEGGRLTALSEITFTTIEVCIVFIIMRIFKIISLRFLDKRK